MDKDKVQSVPPILGRYRLLKEKRRSQAYRSFLAYDLKLKKGVIVKLIPVHGYQKKHLPILWEYLEKTAHGEENVSKVVELDYQNDSLLLVEEYLEGRYFNSQIFENPHEYTRFEVIMFRIIDILKRLHSKKIPHGFLDFSNMKVTPRDGVIIEDYPVLHWLEMNGLLPRDAITEPKQKPENRDIRQLGLVLFNVYRTQMVPEFHAFPDKYTRQDIYTFFRNNSFAHFSDVEKILAKLLLCGEPKGYVSINEAHRDISELLGSVPPPVQVRDKFPAFGGKPEKPAVATAQAPAQEQGTASTQDFARKLGRPVIEVQAEDIEEPREAPSEKKPEIYSKSELTREGYSFRTVVWGSLLISFAILAITILILVKGFLANSVPEIVTPDLAGISFEEAKKTAKKAGLKINISAEEYSDDLPKGIIIMHQPPAGVRTKSGRTVYAVVSRGLAVVTVPNLIDLSEAAAENNLLNSQLTAGKKEYVFSEDVPVGIVMDQNPSANEKVAVGEKVDLIISAGLLKSQLPMPDLMGMTLSESLNVLEQKKLRVRKITRSYSPYFEKDAIKYQMPAPNSEVEYGNMVDLDVAIPSKDAPLEEFKVAVNITLPNFEGRKRIRIMDQNQRSVKEIYNALHPGREKISLLAEGVGRTKISVFIDDSLVREETF